MLLTDCSACSDFNAGASTLPNGIGVSTRAPLRTDGEALDATREALGAAPDAPDGRDALDAAPNGLDAPDGRDALDTAPDALDTAPDALDAPPDELDAPTGRDAGGFNGGAAGLFGSAGGTDFAVTGAVPVFGGGSETGLAPALTASCNFDPLPNATPIGNRAGVVGNVPDCARVLGRTAPADLAPEAPAPEPAAAEPEATGLRTSTLEVRAGAAGGCVTRAAGGGNGL